MQLQKAVIEKMRIADNIHRLTVVKSADIPGLADCPWPPADSHCGLCTVWHPSEVGFDVWGEYAGDPNRKSFHAQTFCVEADPYGKIKRFVFKVARARSTSVPENDGLLIGIVDMNTLNDPNKLYDPSQWEWAGYLSTLPGGVPIVHYYICADIDQTFDPTKMWYLLMVTNGSYEVCGWQMSGFGASDFPPDVQPLWRYFLNEPGQPDGWQQMDNYFRGCVIPYCEGGGAIVEPDTHIETPIFPGTAQEGVPYEFSFAQMHPTAFPCGCPSTLWFDIVDRDTGNPIGDKAISTLPCGYGGLNWGGTINFSGSFTFHGQVRAGHFIGGEYPVDDTYDFDVVITGYPCSHWTNQSDCEAHGCWWWNSSCHEDQPTQCSQLNNQSDCERWGCYWYDGACHSSPQQPEICDWIDAQGGPTSLDITDIFVIIDSYLYNTPPSGYTFIPTLTNVFGVIDYYLGFDGDAKTGCDYF